MNEAEQKVYYRALGVKLRESREAAGIDPRVVGKALGVTRTCVYNWEAGRSRIPFDKVMAMADLYGVKAEDLTP